MLGAAPFSHVLGLATGIFSTLTSGAAIAIVRRFEPEPTLALMTETGTTILLGVPTMCIALCQAARSADALPPIRIAHVGGAAVPAEVARDFERTFGGEVYEGYGLTEVSGIGTTYVAGQERKVGSVGTPLGDTELRIVSLEGEPLPAGEVGEIEFRGSSVIPGYWENPEATAEAIDAEGWLATGDLGYLDDDGYLFLVDRKKDLILRGGYSVYPREVEEALYEHPDVLEAAVIGLPDETLGEEVAAVVVARPGTSPSADELQAWAKERVAAYKYPRRVIFVDDLPKGPTGQDPQARDRRGGAELTAAPIVDGHLDLAENVTLFGRDLTQSVAAIRAAEQRTERQATVSLPELKRGGIAVAIATVTGGFLASDVAGVDFVPRSALYSTPEEAEAHALAQIDLYERWQSEGWVRVLRSATDLDHHLDLWRTDGRLGVVLLMEGADPIVEVSDLTAWWRRGLRIVGLTFGDTRYGSGVAGGEPEPRPGRSDRGRSRLAVADGRARVRLGRLASDRGGNLARTRARVSTRLCLARQRAGPYSHRSPSERPGDPCHRGARRSRRRRSLQRLPGADVAGRSVDPDHRRRARAAPRGAHRPGGRVVERRHRIRPRRRHRAGREPRGDRHDCGPAERRLRRPSREPRRAPWRELAELLEIRPSLTGLAARV